VGTRLSGVVAISVALAACSVFADLSDIRVGNGLGDDARADAEPPPQDAGGGRDAVSDTGVDACPDGGCSTLSDGLVGYWKLDGNALDSTAGASHLVAEPASGAPLFVAGKVGDGFSPRIGSTFLCPECVVLKSTAKPALATSGDFTISIWASRTANPNTDSVWWHYGLFDNGQLEIGVYSTNTAPTPAYPGLRLKSSPTVVAKELLAPAFDFRASANTGVWTHIIAFRRGSTIGLRVNGDETLDTTDAGVGAHDMFRLAYDQGGYPWQGAIDEVGKWNRALTAEEMDALYNGGAGRSLP
jgi:hypothetical protein